MKINKFQLYDVDEYKLQKLKMKLIDAFYNWIKIKLPDSLFANLTQSYPDLLQLIFAELEGEEESLENATNCVIELILLAKKKREFEGINTFVINHVSQLQNKVNEAVSSGDAEKGMQFQDIFVELGVSHINQIVE